MGVGYEVLVESATSHGRIDLALPLPDIVWIFEFKVAGRCSAEKALQQIIDRDYAGKHRDGRRRIVLVGVEVDEDERNLVGFETTELTQQAVAARRPGSAELWAISGGDRPGQMWGRRRSLRGARRRIHRAAGHPIETPPRLWQTPR